MAKFTNTLIVCFFFIVFFYAIIMNYGASCHCFHVYIVLKGMKSFLFIALSLLFDRCIFFSCLYVVF